MGYTIDIDTGSTFTDGVLMGDGRFQWVKVDTTPHDLTECVGNCINELARQFGFKDSTDLLRQTDIIRLSSTISTNALIQKTGARLGLIVSKGYENTLYSRGDDRIPVLEIIPSGMVLGIKGYIDNSGDIAEDTDMNEVREAVKELLIRGARIIVVSLINSSLNPSLERRVKDFILAEYPPHYLGSVPVLTSTEVSLVISDAYRTNAAILDAYVHREMVRFLYKGEENLRKQGYPKNLFIVHNWGGVAQVGKTKAIDTFSSGPAAALLGAAYISRLYDLPTVVAFELGGTSADCGTIINGKCSTTSRIEIEGIPLEQSAIGVKSVGSAGCSIARVSEGRIAVGPRSAGSMPGPACFDLGGTEPTVADACVVLGYIDPGYFHGGRKKLNAAKAYDTIKRKLAQPLNIGVEEAAFQVIEEGQAVCGQLLKHHITESGLNAADAALLSFGGAGGIYCCRLAEMVGFSKIYVPPFAAVFGAFGSSTLDIAHQYEIPVVTVLRDSRGKYSSNSGLIYKAVQEMRRRAEHDVRAEGFAPEQLNFNLELQLSSSAQSFTTCLPAPYNQAWNKEDTRAVCDKLNEAYGTPVSGEVILLSLKLIASCSLVHGDLLTYDQAGSDPQAAFKGTRKVFWGNSGFTGTPIYERGRLQCGNIVTGPSIIEGEDTTILIPEGRRFSVDKFLFGIIEKE